jgi:hypothetical protein
MLEAELFAFLQRTADAAFAVTRGTRLRSDCLDTPRRTCCEVLDGHA